MDHQSGSDHGSEGRWPEYKEKDTVVGMNLLDFIDWADASNRVLNGGEAPDAMPVLALPPVQRSAVWRPKQVLDLWDSLMRGLPIGTFYLVERPAHLRRHVVRLATEDAEAARVMPFSGAGFDLLDGQQRLRALLAGALGFAEEKRCLWIDLGEKTAEDGPCLRLTSKAQPFGYDAEGAKLGVDQRRRAREAIEPKKHVVYIDDGSAERRRAYDLELFDIPVKLADEDLPQSPSPVIQPPFPHGTDWHRTFKLHDLLAAWREGASDPAWDGVAAIRRETGDAPAPAAVQALHEAFCKARDAQVALLRVDPTSFRNRDQDLLALFQRIGAGGTALSLEERLYSIYKSHDPNIRTAVDTIHEQVGRVLPPTKIVATALRIANVRTSPRYNRVPSEMDFALAMTAADAPAEPQSNPEQLTFRQSLERLIPPASTHLPGTGGPLSQAFKAVKSLLAYPDPASGFQDPGNFWLPDVMLVELPVELWQVLVFWAANHPEPADRQLCRQEAVRFALFWRLCVTNNERAAIRAFEHISGMPSGPENFPGSALYRRIIGVEGDSFAYAFIPPEEFEGKLNKEPTENWRTDAERFGEGSGRNNIGSNWWWSARKMLPWLQRDYVRRVFPGYMPLTDHEDDRPYDFDHICPRNDWGYYVAQARLDGIHESTQRKMREGRVGIGESIGNFRIIESSENKGDQDDDIGEKMPFVLPGRVAEAEIEEDARKMVQWAFSPEHRKLWAPVSCPGPVIGRMWNNDRLAAFQQAVEHRATWLYRRFHDDLGYAAWTAEPSQNDGPQ